MKRHNWIKHLFLITLFTFSSLSWAEKKLVLGIYQYMPKAQMIHQYTPFADYLSSKLPEHKIEFMVLDSNQLLHAIRDHQIDMLLTNPYHYELMRNEVSLKGVAATIQRGHEGYVLDSIGGVIFTRAAETKINKLADLEQSVIAIPSKRNTGAYLLPLYELYKAEIKIKPHQFLKTGNNISVVESVMQGKAQVGFVRIGILEKLFNEGKLKPEDIKIINRQHASSYPLIVSTALYPEWPFVFMPGLNLELQKQITVALFSLQKDSPAALQSGILGFVSPSNYQSYEHILRKLKLPPYNIPSRLNLEQFWHLYKWPAVSFGFFIVTMLGLLIFSEVIRNRIEERDKKLIKQSELDQTLLKLPKYAEDHTEQELMQFATEQLEKLTDSRVAFMHLFDDFEQEIALVSWSKNTLEKFCHIEEYNQHYNLDKAGVWADAIRAKQPIIMNDYGSYPNKKGVPEGHAVLERMISLPVLDGDRVVMVAGVGNKIDDYTDTDADVCQLVCNELWHLIKEERTQKEIKQQKNRYEDLLNDLGTQYVVFSYDPFKHQTIYLSAGFEQIFNKPRFALFNKSLVDEIDWLPESMDVFNQAIETIISSQENETAIKMSFLNEVGEKRTVSLQLHGSYEYHELRTIDGLIKDVTEEIEAENKLKQAAQVFDYANEGILITNHRNQIIRANQRMEAITGYKEAELIGKNPRTFSSGEQNNIFYESLWNSLTLLGYWEGELFNKRKDGSLYPCSLKISTVYDEEHQPEYYIALFADITEEHKQQEQLERMAHYDALTNLPNRLLLTDRIHQAISSLERTGEVMGLLFVDLDGFKEINDAHGHSYGDVLLKTLAKRLQKLIRKQDTVARLGGDEFVIILSGSESEDHLYEVEQRILAEINEPVVYKNQFLKVSGSIGVVYYHSGIDQELDPDQLIRLADQTMYQAKLQGKNRINRYKWHDSKEQKEILAAFDNHEFQLFYQPKIDFKSGQIISLEALIRWVHPEKGIIAPFFFLNKLKNLDLIGKLSILVVKEAGRFLTEMKQKGSDLNVSININGYDLLSDDFTQALEETFEHSKEISCHNLTLELLESSALENINSISEQIDRLKLKGYRFAIDDFGTGHASLSYMKNLPVNEVKIDQEFVRNIFNEPSSFSIIEAIKSMSEAFNVSVVAEGAETDAHVELLIKLGINHIQGYAISKPISETDTKNWIQNWHYDEKWQTIAEIGKHQKELLKAKLAHSAWVNKVRETFADEDDVVTMDFSRTTCNFAKWLHSSYAKEVFVQTKRLAEIDMLHAQIHIHGQKAIEHKLADEMELGQQELAKLDELSKQLEAHLSSNVIKP